MRKPRVAKPGSLNAFSLSRTLPPLRLPRSAVAANARPHPRVGMPTRSLASLAHPMKKPRGK